MSIGVLIMKKLVIVAMMCLMFAAALSAQNTQWTAAETMSISGTLAVENGLIAVKTENQTYYTYGFQHLINFVDGVKEGAALTLEGYVLPYQRDPENPHFMATKLTINGKSYELQTPYGNRGLAFNGDFGYRQNRDCPYCGDARGYNRQGRNYGGRNYPRMNRNNVNPGMYRGYW